MPKLFDPRADNVPDWIWHPRPHPSIGDGEIIPTSDPDEVELEVSILFCPYHFLIAIVDAQGPGSAIQCRSQI